MRRLILSITITIMLFSCTKSQKEEEPVTCLGITWLDQKKAELSNCTCVTGIYQGIYLGQPVFEIRIIDPLCNGINAVYKTDGTVLLNSGDQSLYWSYLSSVQNLQLIWTCSKSK